MSSKKIVSLTEACLSYDGFNSVVNKVSLDICEGDVVIIKGESGSGKTTLAKSLTGLLQPDSGKILVETKVSLFANKGLGINPELTLVENAKVRFFMFDSRFENVNQAVNSVIKFSELEEVKDKTFRELPSLLRSRFALSLYMMGRFELLIVDENIGVNDPSFRLKNQILIESLVESARSIVVFSRKYSPFDKFANRFYRLSGGELLKHDAS